MTKFSEGNLVFVFPENWEVSQYDRWIFYRLPCPGRLACAAQDRRAFDRLNRIGCVSLLW